MTPPDEVSGGVLLAEMFADAINGDKYASRSLLLLNERKTLQARIEALEGERDADWRKFVHLRDDNERIRVLGEELAQKESRIEALSVLTVEDAEGLARVCMSFQTEQVHKQDEIGAKVWREQGRRLSKFAEARAAAEEER